MKDSQLKILIKFRIDQADETFEEANILFERNAYRGAINRAYYAMFYSVLALLATKQLGSSKHSGAISMFDREFVKSGIFPKELSKYIHTAFDERQVQDYGEFAPVSEDVAKDNIMHAQVFVKSIKEYLFDVPGLLENRKK